MARPIVDVLRTAASEVWYTARAAGAVVPVWPLPPPHATAEHPPVVLVHGFLGHDGMLRPLARHLLEAGFPEVHCIRYPSTRLALQDIVDRIAAVVKPLAVHGPVDLVGHSLGAVASRAFVKHYGGDAWVRRLVCLGGPHSGTALYRAVPPWLQPALDPRGPWVERLAEGPEPVPTTVIRAAYDHQVFPPRRGSIAGVGEVVVTHRGHNGLLWSLEAHQAVVAALS